MVDKLKVKAIYNDFLRNVNLSDEQIKILDMVLKKESIVKISMEIGISQRTVSYEIKKIKDLSNQVSNSVAAIGNQIANQTATITDLFNQQTINELRDKLATTRDELSNTRQTAVITENILRNLSVTAPKPPCYYPCCTQSTSSGTTTTGS